MDDTVVLTMSEFGRAVSENGNRGTDHGHGNAMMVLGGGVRGGRIYGKWPGLAREHRYERRDLAVTTDFRDVFAEIVVNTSASSMRSRSSLATTCDRRTFQDCSRSSGSPLRCSEGLQTRPGTARTRSRGRVREYG